MTAGSNDTPECGGRTTAHLKQVSEEAARMGGLSIAEMIETIGASSIALAILILSLPVLTPIPGPFGLVFGSCLAIVSIQIMTGARHLNLPGFIGDRRMSAGAMNLVLRYTGPVIGRVEKLMRRGRLPQLTGPVAQRLLGFPVLLLACAIALPVPFGNFLPVVALIIIAMALLENDGLAIIFGLGAAAFALGVMVGLLYGISSASSWILA